MVLELCPSSPALWSPMDHSPPSSPSMGFSSSNTGVGCYALLQGIFPTQGPCLLGLLHWQADSLPLMPPGKPLGKYKYYIFVFVSCKFWLFVLLRITLSLSQVQPPKGRRSDWSSLGLVNIIPCRQELCTSASRCWSALQRAISFEQGRSRPDHKEGHPEMWPVS